MKTIYAFFALTLLITSCKPSNPDCVEGDCYNGKGKEELPLGESYKGDFKNGVRHGVGTMRDESEDVTYEGEWADGDFNGIGKITWGPRAVSPGGYYKGGWKDGLKSGQGVLDWGNLDKENSGDKYVGEWKLDFMHGKGKYMWSDGGWAEGDFVEGLLHGEAVRFWPSDDDTDAQTYTGQWEDDYQNGYGVLLWDDETKYEGEWKDGEFHGKGKYTLPDGDYFEGEWIEGECVEFDEWLGIY